MDFIIKKPTSSNRTIRMPDTLIEKISKLAREQDVSFNQVVVQCCEFAIENIPKHKDSQETDK
jgi:predicted HicB family RNase H-like nuclease